MGEPARGEAAPPRRTLTTTAPRGEDLTARQIRRLEQRAKERRRITPQALALRFKAVWVAYRQAVVYGDRQALIGELENCASACMAWARYIRSTHRL